MSQRAAMLQESLPYELTLSYQLRREEMLGQWRWEQHIRGVWRRFAFLQCQRQCNEARRAALKHVWECREALCKNDSSAGSAQPLVQENRIPSQLAPAVDEAHMAAQLGLDITTYHMLRELEQREICPEDYELLGRLDEVVKPATLDNEQLQCFPTMTYSVAGPVLTVVGMPASKDDPIAAEFNVDFWRVPICSEDEDFEEVHAADGFGYHCFGLDFWKIPLPIPADPERGDHETVVEEFSSFSSVCGVCLLDFEEGDELRVLTCDHAFHRTCIDHWLLVASTACPDCKRDLRQ